jgi:cytochrome c
MIADWGLPMSSPAAPTDCRRNLLRRFGRNQRASAAFADDVDLAAGKTSFNKCLACHSIGEGAKNKVGPVLNGLDGRKSGTAADYNYSDANKNSGITWSEAVFKEYIKDPKAKIPGTKMAFAGIKSENEINHLWAYVSQFDAERKIKSKKHPATDCQSKA